jgi:hypothetical protein
LGVFRVRRDKSPKAKMLLNREGYVDVLASQVTVEFALVFRPKKTKPLPGNNPIVPDNVDLHNLVVRKVWTKLVIK